MCDTLNLQPPIPCPYPCPFPPRPPASFIKCNLSPTLPSHKALVPFSSHPGVIMPETQQYLPAHTLPLILPEPAASPIPGP